MRKSQQSHPKKVSAENTFSLESFPTVKASTLKAGHTLLEALANFSCRTLLLAAERTCAGMLYQEVQALSF